MLIERTNKKDINCLQHSIDFLSYKEATGNTQANQTQIDRLVKLQKKGWWKANRKRLITEY